MIPTKHHSDVVVHDVMTTLRRLTEGASIARLGDGEIKLILYMAMKFQEPDERLHLRLLEVLRSNLDGLLVGVPYLSDAELDALEPLTHDGVINMVRVHRARLNAMWDPSKEYYNAFVTRPDTLPMTDYTEFFALWRSIWQGRHVVVVEPREPRYSFSQAGVLTGARSVEHINVPRLRAWAKYWAIRKKCREYPRNRLFLLAAGPTATVLAHDLHKAGYQALDVGHIWKWLKDEPDVIHAQRPDIRP